MNARHIEVDELLAPGLGLCPPPQERTVFAWGCRDNGRLGGVGDKRTSEPQEVTSLMRVYRKYRLGGYVRAVAAGQAHSVALTDGERVITWGAGAYGQLGNGFGFDSELPGLVDGLYNVVQVSAGDKHTVALVWNAARPRPPNWEEEQARLARLDVDERLEDAEKKLQETINFDPFGKDDPTTFPPAFVVNDKGEATDKMVPPRANELYAWGWNGFGELGIGDELPRLR